MLVSPCQTLVKTIVLTELEMTGLVINIHLWKHLLLRVEFDCAVDHGALPYIMKSKKSSCHRKNNKIIRTFVRL